MSSPLILTLKLEAIAFDRLDALRKRHFPAERNFLPAHVTLFHALPADQNSAIQQTLQAVCAETPALPLAFPTLRFLGKGVAVAIDCPELIRLRQRLTTDWHDWLSAQDRQPYRPHVTIQNKVRPDEARRLYDDLASVWEPLTARGEGLLLWRYLGGPWELVSEFAFVEPIEPSVGQAG